MNITEIIAKYSSVDQPQGPKLDIFGFDNYILSIGVFKEERQFGRLNLVLDQVFGTFRMKHFPEIYNTLTFAVDPKYKD